MSDRSDGPDDFSETYRKLLGLDESFSVKSHYPEYKAAERGLAESEARLRAMFEAVPFEMYLLGSDGTFLVINESFRRSFGDLRGRRPEDVDMDAAIKAEFLADLRATERGASRNRVYAVESAGGTRWVMAVLSPVMIDGVSSGVAGVNIDITEQKRAERLLLTMNEDLERMVDERTRALGLVNAELGRRSLSLERALAELRNVQERLVQTRYQASVVRVLAAIAHELNSPLASAESAAGHLASIHDEAAAAIRKLRSMPEPLARLVDRILDGQADVPYCDKARREALEARLADAGCAEPGELADDLCDLGESALSDDDLALVAGPGGVDAVGAAWVLGSMFGSSALAAKAARRSADVVRSLNAYLELARPGESALVEFDIAGRLMSYAAYGSAGTLSLAFELEEGLRAYGDPERLDLVWENLVKNALYAAGKAGKVTVRARSDGSGTLVSVEDDGAGVEPSMRDRIFEPFVSAKALEEGKGLGLDICRRIVDTHGGDISFESEPGRTVFTVRLPGRPDGAADR